ncbi:uncharacterized protein C8Q71DRAFT_775254 [Rhodofomes roseus]|uniref:Uncharacterized protein n=1 Tax=Rhodofomes roseus TaxID=34475 RepID=A0ABQ8K734_9APHY|nr:uncharacterized protein C8Q71DRAFT_775254 [Rhodofomes roseus]KAH9832852.1 hypothetical protein C8Q71DRAFT_775254 [Rhodofomes roseus]
MCACCPTHLLVHARRPTRPPLCAFVSCSCMLGIHTLSRAGLPIYPPSCLFTHLLTRPLGRLSRPAYSASPCVSRLPCRSCRCAPCLPPKACPSSLSVVEPAPLVHSSVVCSRGLCPVCTVSPCAPCSRVIVPETAVGGLLTYTHHSRVARNAGDGVYRRRDAVRDAVGGRAQWLSAAARCGRRRHDVAAAGVCWRVAAPAGAGVGGSGIGASKGVVGSDGEERTAAVGWERGTLWACNRSANAAATGRRRMRAGGLRSQRIAVGGRAG